MPTIGGISIGKALSAANEGSQTACVAAEIAGLESLFNSMREPSSTTVRRNVRKTTSTGADASAA
jgi:hypothetical protein